MAILTKETVERVLGPVDDELAAELVMSGANEEELREACSWITNDEALINELGSPPSGRAGELVDILTSYEEDSEAD